MSIFYVDSGSFTTLNVTGLLTTVSQSVQYVSSSQFNIGGNKVVLNTNTPAVRFGGMSVIDSGSANNSGSIYWDSVNNRWLYENVTGASYASAIIVAGPKNYGSLGQERGLIVGRVPVTTGDDHIDTAPASSSIRVDMTSGRTDIENNLYVTGSVTASAGGTFSGNVGIGTSTPSLLWSGDSKMLHISGSTGTQAVGVRVQSSLTSAEFYSSGVTNAWGLYSPNASNFEIYTNNVSRLFISSSGNIGIGTTTPLQKLDVYGGNISISTNSGNGSYFAGSLKFIQDTSDWNAGYTARWSGFKGYVNGYANQNDLAVFVGNSDSELEAMRFKYNGNVGIGTTNPIDLLHISGSDIGVRVEGGTRAKIILSNPTATWQMESPTATGNVPAGALGIVESGVGSRFTILTGGNVGIGNTSPYATLDVWGTVNSSSAQYYNLWVADNSVAYNSYPKTGIAFGWRAGSGTAVNTIGAGILAGKENTTVDNAAGYLSFTTTPAGGLPTVRAKINSTGIISGQHSTTQGPYINANNVVTITNGSTLTLMSGVAGAAMITIYETGGGKGGVFFATYTGTVVKIAGDGSATDAGGDFAVYKDANSHTVTLKNRYGIDRDFVIGIFSSYAQ